MEKPTNHERQILALADGNVFRGNAYGFRSGEPVIGEVVFNTSMYGYQEILTDPSYAEQIICFTSPHIGNVGCNQADNESVKVYAKGVIFRDVSRTVTNFRAEESLNSFLDSNGVPSVTQIDTRRLTLHLRDNGSQTGVIFNIKNNSLPSLDLEKYAVSIAESAPTMEGQDLIPLVSTTSAYEWIEGFSGPFAYKKLELNELLGRPHLVVIDCGVKRSMLRLLTEVGFRITVVSAFTTALELANLKPDGIFLSNGPGDPATASYVVELVREFLGKVPIFGICLGHQILALALGGETFKLKFGHRGANHPVKDLTTGRIEITVQNHGFAVEGKSLSAGYRGFPVEITHLNLNDNTIEGLSCEALQAFSVQYHPESSPGPHDSRYLFKRFFDSVINYKR
jgi:carbamoyl-phosphate synthase small subunit